MSNCFFEICKNWFCCVFCHVGASRNKLWTQRSHIITFKFKLMWLTWLQTVSYIHISQLELCFWRVDFTKLKSFFHQKQPRLEQFCAVQRFLFQLETIAQSHTYSKLLLMWWGETINHGPCDFSALCRIRCWPLCHLTLVTPACS